MRPTISLTYEQLEDANQALMQLDLSLPDKLSYAANTHVKPSIGKAMRKIQDQVNSRIQDINIDNCHVDDKGIIQQKADGNLLFTKEGQKARNRAIELLKKETEEWRADVKTYPVSSWSTQRRIPLHVMQALQRVLFPPDLVNELVAQAEADEVPVHKSDEVSA